MREGNIAKIVINTTHVFLTTGFSIDGSAEGDSNGCEVGKLDGCLDGNFVGDRVGCFEGAKEGLVDG